MTDQASATPTRGYANTFAERIRYVLVEAPTAPVEFLISTVLLAWGIWFCFYADAFRSLNTYGTMRAVIPHSLAWAAIFGILGVARMSCLGFTTHGRPQVAARKMLMFTDCCVWIFSTVAFFMANPGSVGVPTAFVFALASAWVYWRLPACRTSQHGQLS